MTSSAQLVFSCVSNGLTGTVLASLSETASGTDFIVQPQSIATGSWQAIGIGACASIYEVAIKNTDPTNYVEVALDNAGANKIAKLLPGANGAGGFLFLQASAGLTLYAQAHTGACVVVVAVREP
jgi:hypothetical protein